METIVQNGYKIDFYSKEEWFEDTIPNENRALNFTREDELMYDFNYGRNEYAGKSSEVPEELVDRIVDWSKFDKGAERYFRNHYNPFNSLSDLPYCVITKID